MAIKKENILVLGAGHYQISGIVKLKEKGYFVVALDGNPNAEGENYADEFFVCDIKSFISVKEFIDNKGKEFFSACMCFCTDAPMNVVGEVNTHYNLKGLKQNLTNISADKSIQRSKMNDYGLPTPQFQTITNKNDKLEIEYPCIIKPVDSAGSRGVSLVKNEGEYKVAVNNAFVFTKSKKCLAEEYINGIEYTVEAIIHNNETNIIGISEKVKTQGNYTVSSQIQYNSPRVNKNRDKITSTLIQFFKALGYDNSITHTELIISEKNDQVYIIESSLRSGGFGIFDEVLPYLTSEDVVGKTIDLYLGKKVKMNNSKTKSVIMNFLSAYPGRIKTISIDQHLFQNYKDADHKYGFYLNVGEEVKKLDVDEARVGYIFTYSDDWQNAFYLSNLVEYSIKINVE